MSFEIHALQRIRVYEEPAGSYGVAFGTEGSYLDVPANEGTATMTVDKEMLPVPTTQQYLDGRRIDVIGRRRCTLTFTMPLASHGVVADASAMSPTQSTVALLRILKAVMGGIYAGNLGSAAAAGSTTTVVNVTAGHGSRFTAGGAIAVWNTTLALWEMREIYSVTGDALTLKVALRNTPTTTTSKVLNASTCYLTEDPDTSLQFLVIGREADDQWQLTGMQLASAPTIAFTDGGLPLITFSLSGVAHTALPASTLTFLGATYTTHSPAAIIDGDLIVSPSGSAQARTSIIASAYEFKPAISYIDIPTPGGVENVHRKRRARVNPACTWSFTCPYEDQTWWSARDARTGYHFALQLGGAGVSTSGGSFVLLTCGTSQVEKPQRVDGGGIASQMVEGLAMLDTSGDQSTEIRRSAFRMHFA